MLRLNCKIEPQEDEFAADPDKKESKETLYTDFESSNIDGMAYKVEKKQLWIRFKDGSVYTYYDVPMSIAKGLYKAGSKGKYFWKKIRNNPRYKVQKLTASLNSALNNYLGLKDQGGV